MITSTLDEGVRVLLLARPERRNALEQSMVDGLRAALEAAATDDATRAVVLTGEGAAFCAGADAYELGLLTDLASGLTAETIAQSLLVGSEDHAEGVQAAREDRSSSFTGR